MFAPIFKCTFTIALSLTALLALPAMALPAVAASADPAKFVMEYYTAKAKVKFPLELHGYYSKRLEVKQAEFEKMRKENSPEYKMMMEMFKLIGGQEPTAIKIVGTRTGTSERPVFSIAPVIVPEHYKKQMTPGAKTSLKGTVGLVKEAGAWKVDKDFWKFEVVSKDGKFSETTGFNDEKSAAGAGDSDALVSSRGIDNGDGLTKLMDAFKSEASTMTEKTGKSIYAVVKVDADGLITDVKVGGEKTPQPAAEAQVRDILLKTQPFKPLPKKYAGQTNAWMMFDWSDKGTAISGPYFSEGEVSADILGKVRSLGATDTLPK